MPTITSVKAIQVLDSRGLPTVSCSIKLSDGSYASAIVPSGASTGTKEALELRDGTNAYLGKGVQKAVTNINNIIIDLDGTNDKSKLGANAILAVSLAVSHVAAKSKNIDLFEHFSSIFK